MKKLNKKIQTVDGKPLQRLALQPTFPPKSGNSQGRSPYIQRPASSLETAQGLSIECEG